jgi:signal peptidase II
MLTIHWSAAGVPMWFGTWTFLKKKTDKPQVKTPFQRGLVLAAVILIGDQISKWWMMEHVMNPPQAISVTPFFNLVVAWNRGVSFGLFGSDSPYGGWILSLIALVIVGFLTHWLYRIQKNYQAIAIGMIIGGALGNVADRVMYGAVYDFLDVHVAGYHWPAFNVADSGITIGAVILVLDSLFAKSDNGDSDNTSETS